MTDSRQDPLRDWLRAGDPVRDEPALSDGERAALRARVLEPAAADPLLHEAEGHAVGVGDLVVARALRVDLRVEHLVVGDRVGAGCGSSSVNSCRASLGRYVVRRGLDAGFTMGSA